MVALDPTALEANYRDSILKYFKDNLRSLGVSVTFDRGMKSPVLQGHTISEWISINFGNLDIGANSEAYLFINCCSRKDDEGRNLVRLGDKIRELLSSDGTDPSGIRKIPHYDSSAPLWVQIGGLSVVSVTEGNSMTTEDETKYKMFTVRILWASKI